MRFARGGFWICAVLALLPGCGQRGGGVDAAATVRVTDAWSRTSPPGARAGVVYLTLASDAGDRLIAVSVPASVAGRAEMHEVFEDAARRLGMRPVDGVDLPAGAAIVFGPGGRHIMLTALARPLMAGDTLAVTLRFRRAVTRTVPVVVRDE